MRTLNARLPLIAFILLFAVSTFAGDALDQWYFRDARVVNKVRFVGGFFIGVGNNGMILTSPDGQTWTGRNSGTTADLRDVAYGSVNALPAFATRYIAVGTAGTILISSNAVDWSSVVNTINLDLNDVAYGSFRFIATTTRATTNQPNAFLSSDTTSWTPIIFPNGTGSWTHSLISIGNIFVAAVGDGLGDQFWRSSGGTTWQNVGLASLAVRGTAYGNDRIVAFGFEGPPRISTNLGQSWFFSAPQICVMTGTCLQGNDIAFGNSTFAALPSLITPRLVTSTNGETWINRSALAGKSLICLTFGNGTFVTAGASGIYQSEPVSTPGLSISKNSSSNAVNITVAGEVGRGYRLQTSINISNWFDRLSFTNTSPSMEFVEPITNASQLFYRAVTP